MSRVDSLATSTPVKPKVDGYLSCTIRLPNNQEIRLKLSEDMRAQWFGSPDTDYFVARFMDDAPNPAPAGVQFPTSRKKREPEMYAPLVSGTYVAVVDVYKG